MKKKILLLGLLAFTSHIYAHSQDGLFRTSNDFKQNRVLDAAGEKQVKIHLHDFIRNAPTVTMVIGGERKTYLKSELYGYREQNISYRFYENAVYQIEDTGDVMIYSQTLHIPMSKGFKVEKKYFHGTADGAILPGLGSYKTLKTN